MDRVWLRRHCAVRDPKKVDIALLPGCVRFLVWQGLWLCRASRDFLIYLIRVLNDVEIPFVAKRRVKAEQLTPDGRTSPRGEKPSSPFNTVPYRPSPPSPILSYANVHEH